MTISTYIDERSSEDSDTMIASFITSHPQGAVTTITKEGMLQSSVVNVFETGSSQYTFMTKKDTRKYSNILANPTVSFITYDPFSRTEAEIEGIAVEVTDKHEVSHILDTIHEEAKLGRWHISPFVSEADDYTLFTIYPRSMHMTTYWQREAGMEVFHEYVNFNTKMST